MIGSILINNYTVSFLGPSKFMNNERCTVISTNPSVISGKKDSSGNSIPAKMCYISINNDIEFNKLKNLALSVTNRTFDKNCLSDNKSLLISGCILLIIPTFALCLECLFITFFKRDVIKRYV